MEEHHASLTVALALTAGVLCQVVARHIRLPAIILLLACGAALGPALLGIVQPDQLGDGLYGLVEIGMAIILFEGGLNLQSSRLIRQEKTIRFLITIGAVITLLGAGVAAHYILGWTWKLAFLFGSLVVVTGPTVVSPLLRDMRLHPRLKTILEAEGVLIDPIGAILASLLLQVALIHTDVDTIANELGQGAVRFGFGLLAGILGGLVLGGIFKVRSIVPHSLHNIFALSYILLLFAGCEHFHATSGILAVTVAGVVVGFLSNEETRELREFKDQMTLLLVGLLFILLAADIQINDIRQLGWKGVGVVAFLVLVVRPIAVLASTSGSSLHWREKSFIAWVAPRGIVAAAISTITADALDANGIEGGAALRGMVFLTIAATVVLAGVTARPAASLLDIRLPSRNRIAILGVDGLSLAFAGEFKRIQTPVVFIDSDPKRCQKAQELGYTVVYGDALEERTMTRARFDLVETAVGLTGNDHLNSLFVGYAREWFRVPNGLVVLGLLSGKTPPQHVRKSEADILFDGPHDTERWDVRWRHGDLKIAYFRFIPEEQAPEPEDEGSKPELDKPGGQTKTAERYVIMTIFRNNKLLAMTHDFKLKRGDVASIAVYEPDFDEVVRVLKKEGWNHPAACGLDERPKKEKKPAKEPTGAA